MKTGVAIADIMAGMYSAVAILAALRHRDRSGRGQHIDMSLLDAQVAWLSNAGQYYLTSGKAPARYGNGHPTIVPYQTFQTADGWIILAVGNDDQFRRFCTFAGRPALAEDPLFATNKARVRNRDALIPLVQAMVREHPSTHWLDGLEGLGVPAGPINDIAGVFADPQVQARGMRVRMEHPGTPTPIDLIGSPMKFSDTPVNYRHAPPMLGEHTDEVLADWLNMAPAERHRLRSAGIV